jgi:predicted Fe-Mo cluster-binding NifX family protein
MRFFPKPFHSNGLAPISRAFPRTGAPCAFKALGILGGRLVKIAIPRMGESVAPCFEYCATMAIFTIAEGAVADQVDFPLRSRDPFDRVRLLRDQEVDTIICGGVQDLYEDVLRTSGFQVISWVSGSVDDLLELFLRGQLVPGQQHRDLIVPATTPTDSIREH